MSKRQKITKASEQMLDIKEFALQSHYSERLVRQYCIESRIEGAFKLSVGSRKWLIPSSALTQLQPRGNGTTKQKPELQNGINSDALPVYKRQSEILSKLVKCLNDIQNIAMNMMSSLGHGERKEDYVEPFQRAFNLAQDEFFNGRVFLPVDFVKAVEAFFQKLTEMNIEFETAMSVHTPNGPERAQYWKKAGTIAYQEIPKLFDMIDDQARRIVKEKSEYASQKEIGQPINEAQTEHLSLIRGLLKYELADREEMLAYPLLNGPLIGIINLNLCTEKEKLFPYMLEHCPSVKPLFQNYKSTRERHIDTAINLRNAMKTCLIDNKLGQDLTIVDVMFSEMLRSREWHDNYYSRYRDWLSKYDNELRALSNNQRALYSERANIWKTIEISLLSSEYLKHNCEWCVYPKNQDTANALNLDDKKLLTGTRQEDKALFKKHESIVDSQNNFSIDPIISKAREEHLGKIRDLITEWKDCLHTPNFEEAAPGYRDPMVAIQTNRLFEHLKEHLPSPTLWLNYTIWEDKIDRFLQSCSELLKYIRRDKCFKEMETWLCTEDYAYHLPILKRISEKAQNNSEIKHKIIFRDPQYYDDYDGFESMPPRLSGHVSMTYTMYVDDIPIGTCREENVQIASETYKTVSDFHLKRDDTVVMVGYFRELKSLEDKFHQGIEESLLYQDYRWYTCKYCGDYYFPQPDKQRWPQWTTQNMYASLVNEHFKSITPTSKELISRIKILVNFGEQWVEKGTPEIEGNIIDGCMLINPNTKEEWQVHHSQFPDPLSIVSDT